MIGWQGDLAVRRSIPGVPGQTFVYEGKYFDNSDEEGLRIAQRDNDELKHYLVDSADGVNLG